MQRIAIIALLFVLTGCQKLTYTGDCTIEKVDGKVQVVTVNLPHNGLTAITTFKVDNREEMSQLIEGLESLVLDLKLARDQMPVVEPPLEKSE